MTWYAADLNPKTFILIKEDTTKTGNWADAGTPISQGDNVYVYYNGTNWLGKKKLQYWSADLKDDYLEYWDNFNKISDKAQFTFQF